MWSAGHAVSVVLLALTVCAVPLTVLLWRTKTGHLTSRLPALSLLSSAAALPFCLFWTVSYAVHDDDAPPAPCWIAHWVQLLCLPVVACSLNARAWSLLWRYTIAQDLLLVEQTRKGMAGSPATSHRSHSTAAPLPDDEPEPGLCRGCCSPAWFTRHHRLLAQSSLARCLGVQAIFQIAALLGSVPLHVAGESCSHWTLFDAFLTVVTLMLIAVHIVPFAVALFWLRAHGSDHAGLKTELHLSAALVGAHVAVPALLYRFALDDAAEDPTPWRIGALSACSLLLCLWACQVLQPLLAARTRCCGHRASTPRSVALARSHARLSSLADLLAVPAGLELFYSYAARDHRGGDVLFLKRAVSQRSLPARVRLRP